ncbi:TadG family pilus assembly protein [Thiohalobacter thiocyanaticus]|uniref:DUF2134 domain-containing protein n=1 Tax=Thiohalobacter thiocyanaticus TaxID=585455 RepID=A0A426QI57_9GAMM|nr:TadG family pilus assembly protein [Thiohalobacter thiocyanaticus]RRQ21430.1 hypothetical protein D6C00_05395 [Thiohalobacter thiocyanaticus]
MIRSRQQSGVASFSAIGALAMAVIFTALAIDVGRLSWVAKQLQDTADLAAMDAMTEAGWCAGKTALSQAELEAAAQASAQRNGYSGDLAAEGAVETGRLTTVNGLYTFVPGGPMAETTAVRVTTMATVPSSLVAGGWLGGDAQLQRQAVAHDVVMGGFSAGSFLGSVSSDDSDVLNPVMSGLLGGAVSLSAVSYEGLAAADVGLGELAEASAALGHSADSVEGFLNANMTVGEFLEVMAVALGSGNAAYADLNGLAAAAAMVNDINVGDLIRVSSDRKEDAAEVDLNVFDLVSGSAQIANEGSTVNIPMTLNLPLGLGDVVVDLHLIQGPQYDIGQPGRDDSGDWKTQVRTGQGRLEISIDLSDSDSLPIPGGVLEVNGTLKLYADFARASAWLEQIRCADADSLAHEVRIGARTSAVGLGIGQFGDISDPASGISPTPALSLDVLSGAVSMTADVSADTQVASPQDARLDFTVSQASPLPQEQTAGTPLAGALGNMTGSLAGSLDITLSGGGLLGLLGLTLSDIDNALVSTLLAPLLNVIDDLLLDPLLRALGVHAGGVDVQLIDIQRRDPRLAG